MSDYKEIKESKEGDDAQKIQEKHARLLLEKLNDLRKLFNLESKGENEYYPEALLSLMGARSAEPLSAQTLSDAQKIRSLAKSLVTDLSGIVATLDSTLEQQKPSASGSRKPS